MASPPEQAQVVEGFMEFESETHVHWERAPITLEFGSYQCIFVIESNNFLLRVRPRPKSVDFHNAENRQRPCRMIIRHVKDPLSVYLAWMLSAKLNPSTGSYRQELRCLPLGRKLGIKITCGDWYPPIWCRTKKRYQLLVNVLSLQW
ncbi:hypothetical protein TNCV_3747341 [Trichonephila clavipes]|nr:hypothetical protein TNCV_3747341 [Trichonephila clavipes]